MFRNLRVKRQPEKVVPDLGSLSAQWLTHSPGIPITLRQTNGLPDSTKKRLYRALLPSDLLTRFGINPITWLGLEGDQLVTLDAKPDTSVVKVSTRAATDSTDEVFYLELEDTSLNAINLNFLVLGDPASPRYGTDYDQDGFPTYWGTVRRNLAAEEQAMQAGLAPAQVRRGLGVSQLVLQHLEAFLVTFSHSAYFLEPLTYASAWLFERRGFAYVSGHKLMDDIHKEFQPGGRLHQALDGSTPFRQPDQWRTVRGRAWAIHDGILEVIAASWDQLRMVKRVGRHAGVETFPNSAY
jgi:hypothetical protein